MLFWEKARLVASLSLLASVALTGCGGGGGPPSPPPPTPGPTGPTPPPPPPPGPTPCTFALSRGQCTQCAYSSEKKTHCTSCKSPYELDTAGKGCALASCTPGQKIAPPGNNNPQGNNGAVWPQLCHQDKDTSVFFGIGDWGGMCGWDGKPCQKDVKSADCGYAYGMENIDPNSPCPMNNHNGISNKKIEGRVQKTIANLMMERYKTKTAEGQAHQFVVNVGDNFYPGGIDVHCGKGPNAGVMGQFESVWKGVYENMATELEWWSVLGNHDYGGVCYIKGWDQQIWYTYQQDKWVMPGQYWMRTVQYKDFKADFFFLDGNDADTPNQGVSVANHNICQTGLEGTKEPFCKAKLYPGTGGDCQVSGPHNPGHCVQWFLDLCNNQYNWLVQKMKESDADWQIIVTHYPASYGLGHQINWAKWLEPMGVDLLISGHKHLQKIAYKGVHDNIDTGNSAWVITGGGGGVTSDSLPVTDEGDDDSYGFMEFVMTASELNIKTYTHGGVGKKLIVHNQTTVTPVDKKSDEELLKLGLIPEELVKFGYMPEIKKSYHRNQTAITTVV